MKFSHGVFDFVILGFRGDYLTNHKNSHYAFQQSLQT